MALKYYRARQLSSNQQQQTESHLLLLSQSWFTVKFTDTRQIYRSLKISVLSDGEVTPLKRSSACLLCQWTVAAKSLWCALIFVADDCTANNYRQECVWRLYVMRDYPSNTRESSRLTNSYGGAPRSTSAFPPKTGKRNVGRFSSSVCYFKFCCWNSELMLTWCRDSNLSCGQFEVGAT